MQKFFRKNRINFNHKSNTKGFTLVETLVGLMIFSMSIVAVMAVLASSINDTNYAKQKIVAEYLAQEGLEHARNIRDNNILYTSNGTGLTWDTFKSSDVSYPVDTAVFSGFSRQVTIVPIVGNSDQVKIVSTVTWTQGSGTRTVTFSENLFNWVQ